MNIREGNKINRERKMKGRRKGWRGVRKRAINNKNGLVKDR